MEPNLFSFDFQPLDYSSLLPEELKDNPWAFSMDTCSTDQGQLNSSRYPTLKIKYVQPEKPLPRATMEATAIFLAQNRPFGYKLAEFTIKNGVRWSAYHEFLRPAGKKNKNLKILKATRVHKVLFDDSKRATHVLVSADSDLGKVTKISARREIILSAGAIQTPQILKLSGIGATEELAKLNIKTVHDSPKVGTNYFDHMSLPLFVSLDQPASVTKAKVLTVGALTDYLLHGSGVMGNPGVVGVGSAQNDTYGVIMFGLGTVDEDLFRGIANYRKDTFRAVFPKFENSSQEGVIFLSSCHLPKSRGTVTLLSNRIDDSPEIDPNYLAEDYDVECMKRAIRFSVETVQSQPFVDLGAKIYWPKLKECAEVAPTSSELTTNRPSDEYLECFIRVAAITTYHPGGTCAIGSTADSVLDDALK
jgi:choline dehydrogenase